jgi:hypothetical protein
MLRLNEAMRAELAAVSTAMRRLGFPPRQNQNRHA